MKSDYKNILVTGGRGQLASELERIVKSRGLYAPSSGICGEEGLRESDFIFAGKSDLDICDAKAVGTCIEKNDIGLIINCAAYTAVDKAEEEPEAARRINATGPGVLARQTARYGIPLIHISTDYVFDGKNCRPYTEEDPAHPVSVYGKTKLAGEKRMQRRDHPYRLALFPAWKKFHEYDYPTGEREKNAGGRGGSDRHPYQCRGSGESHSEDNRSRSKRVCGRNFPLFRRGNMFLV